MRVKKCIAAFCLLLSITLLYPLAAATAPATPDKSISVQLFADDQTFNQPSSSRSLWFALPRGVEMKGDVTLSLHMTYSITLLEHLSAITVKVNGTPVSTRKTVEAAVLDPAAEGAEVTELLPVTDAEPVSEFVWDITFDSALLNAEGYNEISITSVQRSVEGDCADIDNPSNWLVLHNDSILSLTYRQPDNPQIGDFNILFYDTVSELRSIVSGFVLLDENDPATVSAMLGMANAAGINYPYQAIVSYDVSNESGMASSADNKIFISRADAGVQWSTDAIVPQAAAPKAGEAQIALFGSTEPYPFNKLLIHGADETALKKAVAFFSSRELVDQADTGALTLSSQSLLTRAHIATVAVNESGKYRFSEYNYDDIVLAGAFHQYAQFSFQQPDGMRSAQGSQIEFSFRHSDALVSERSVITISIEGVPVGSAKLTPGNATGGTLTVDIPEEALSKPVIDVSVYVYNYLGKIECTKDYAEVAWTVIDAKQSQLYFKNSREAVLPSLSGFPYFVSPSGSNVSVFSPSGMDVNIMEAVAVLATRAGQTAGAAFDWTFAGSNLQEETTGGDIVVIGDKRDIALPDAVSAALPVAITDGTYVVQADINVLPETLSNKVVVQVARSPWDFQQKIYVITYDGATGLRLLTEALGENKRLETLDGQLTVIGATADTLAFEVADKTSVPIPLVFNDYVKIVEEFTGLPWYIIAILIVAVLALIVILISLSRRRQNEYEAAGKRHKEMQGLAARDDADSNAEAAETAEDNNPPNDIQ